MDIHLDGHTLTLEARYFRSNTLHAAKCLGFEVDEPYINIDVRRVTKLSLYKFLKKNVPNLQKLKSTVFPELKKVYDSVDSDIMTAFDENMDLPVELSDYQFRSVKDMYRRETTLLAFEMGLGKTVTSLALTRMVKSERTIIICPSIAKWNWYREMSDKWGIDPLDISILDRDPDRMVYSMRGKYVIVNFEMIKRFWEHLSRHYCDNIIIDEAHKIKNYRTGRYREVKKLVDHHNNPRLTLLTGTPITNNNLDLLGYLRLCGHHLGTNVSKFQKAYLNKDKTTKNAEDLRLKLSNFMIRMKTEDCIDLPPLIPQRFYFRTDLKGKDYEAILKETRSIKDRAERIEEKIEEVKSSGMTVEKKRKEVNKLKRENRKLDTEKTNNVHSVNRITAEYKTKDVIRMTDNILEQGGKVVVFTPYSAPIKKMKEYYKDKCVVIEGSTDSYQRMLNEKRFKEEEGVKVFVSNVEAGGESINLTNARHVIFNGFPFSPKDLEQPMKRLHRRGQERSVNVYFTLAENSIDEHIYNIVSKKAGDIQGLVDNASNGNLNYNRIESEVFDKIS